MVDVWSSTRVHEAMVAEAIDGVEGADVPHMWSCVERRLYSFSRWHLYPTKPWRGSQAASVDHTWTQPDKIGFASQLGRSSVRSLHQKFEAPRFHDWQAMKEHVQACITNASQCLVEAPTDDDRSISIARGCYDRLYLAAMDLCRFVRRRIDAATVAGCNDHGDIAATVEITPTDEVREWRDDLATHSRRIPSAVRAVKDALGRVERWMSTPSVSGAGWMSPSLLVGAMPQTVEGWADIFRAGITVVVDVSVRGPRDSVTRKGPIHLMQPGVDTSLVARLRSDGDDDVGTRGHRRRMLGQREMELEMEMEMRMEKEMEMEMRMEMEMERRGARGERPSPRFGAAEVLHFPVVRVPGTAAWIDEVDTLEGATHMPPVPLSECAAAIEQRIADGHKVQWRGGAVFVADRQQCCHDVARVCVCSLGTGIRVLPFGNPSNSCVAVK